MSELQSPNNNPILFRYGVPADANFVFSSWLKSYRKSPVNKRTAADIYYEGQAKIIERLLGRSYLIIACNPDDQDHIFGYLVVDSSAEPNVVFHWLYIKYPFRQLGIAKAMIKLVCDNSSEDSKFFASHIPVRGFFEHICKEFPIIYNPATKE